MSRANDFLDGKPQPSEIDSFLGPDTPKPASAARKMGDLGIGFASGAVGAIKSIADAAGAGNKASSVLSSLNTGINDYLSPEAKADQQTISAGMAEAKSKGFNWDGVKAGAKAFATAPGQAIAQGVGSVVPIIAGTAFAPGVIPAAAVGAGLGIAMGAGTAKGAIYDEIKKRGGTEEEATKAQEYGGVNTDQIALGGALGAVDALTGVSRAATGMVRGALGKEVVKQTATTAAERGIVGRAGIGALKEMPLEAAQGGQEQVAANIAAQRAGYEAGTWDNVASNATLEALASAGPGAMFGAMDTGNKQTPPPPPPPAPQPDQPAPPAGLLGNTPDPLISFPDGTVGRRSEVDAYVAGLPETEQPAARARLMGLAPQPAVPEPVAPSAQMGIDPAAGVISKVAAQAVDTGTVQEIQLNQAVDEERIAYEQAMADQDQANAEQDSVDKPITSGPIAESQMSEEDKRAVLFSNQAVADGGRRHVGTQDGDILNGMGAPFATRMAAARRANMEGKDWTIAPVFDGFVARRKDAFNGASDGVRGASAGSSEQGSDQSAPGVGLGATDGNGMGADARGLADDAVGESRQSAGGVDDTAVGRPGYDTPVEIDARVLQGLYEESKGEQLVNKPEKLEAWRNGTSKTDPSKFPVEIGFRDSDGGLDVNDGRHRIALAAERGEKVRAFIDGKDAEKLNALVNNVQNTAPAANDTKTPASTGEAAEAVASDATPTEGVPGAGSAPVESAGVAPVTQSAQPGAPGQGAGVSQPTQTAPKTAKAGNKVGPASLGSAKADMDHLFGVDKKRAKAIERIAKGTAYFGTNLKAAQFINENGLKDTHEVVRHESGANRWDVREKAPVKDSLPVQSERETRIASALANGGHVVGFDLRDRTGMRLMGLTPEELKTIPADKVRAKPSAEAARTNSTTKGNEDGTQAPETQQAEAQQSQERAPGQPVADEKPSLKKAQAKRAAENEGLHMAAGRAAFAEGKPRVLPSYFTKPGDKNSKDWYRGWDAANAEAPVAKAAEKPAAQEYGAGFEPVGARAFKEGKPRLLPTELRGLKHSAIGQEWYSGWDAANAAAQVASKPEIVVDKAEMRPYRKPDGSVGYEAVPIAEAKADMGYPISGKAPADKAQAATETVAKPERQYHLVAINEKTGAKTFLTRTPVTHAEAVTMKGKYDDKPGRRIQLEDVTPVEPASNPLDVPTDAKTALSEREKAAKAKMFNALGKLAHLAGKNTRMNWTQEEEQQLLPIVIELFDGAMELGAVSFQQAVAYVRDFITTNLDSETADAIPFDTLQGAYISVAGRHKDKPVTSKKEVVGYESLEELNQSAPDAVNLDSLEKPAEIADTGTEETPNEPITGNNPDTGSTGLQGEKPGKLQPDAGTVRRGNAKSNTGNASRGTDKNAPPDYVPAAGGLTREGSWFETAKRNIDLIELAIKIEAEKRPATPEEQTKLSKYVGFGAGAIRNELFPVPPAYAKSQEPNRLIWPQYVRNDRFKPLAERIEALPREWQQSILQSSQYAHYTSEGIIRSVWSALQRMGFNGGQVFEPGMGIGSFSMLMPDAIRAESRYTGVEFDAPTALIAKLLSPQQNMLHGDFIKGKYPKNFFDVNVGNPPFSQTKIFGDPEYAKKGFMLHDFFFAKGIDLVRPGGIQVFVTSKGTMDKQTDKARKYLSERADLLGAIRLPSTAFEDNAGTSVVTDVIFLRKRLPGEAPAGESWASTATVETPDGPVVVNEYFAKHPEMVLGQQRISGNTDDQGRRINSNGMGGEKYTVVSYDATPAELEAKFAKAIEKLPDGVYSEKQGKTEKAKDARVDFDPTVKREGVVYLAKDGTLMRVAEGVGVPLANTAKLSDKDQAWFKSYVGLRDLVQDARFAQLNDGAWEAALAKLNKAYDKFVKEHGHVLDYRVMTRKSTDEEGNVVETESRIPKNRRLLREDYDQALVTSLESISEDGSIVKSPFLKGRTIGKPVSREVKSIGDALAVSLDETGSFDLVDVGRRLKLDEEETIEALGNQIYQTPDGVWQLADEYLAGDVVAKLEEAEAAARINPDLKRNVEALKEAQPEKLGPAQISAKLGASWIPESHVNAFSAEIGAGQVTFDPRTETWQVDGGNKQSGRMAGAEYGTAKRSPSELLEAILNSRSIKITQTIDKKTVPDQEGTTAANEMAKKIKDKFRGWIWTDTDRATELVESYNKNFNNLAPRKFDGSHLTLPGVSLRYKLHPHQLRAIWRMVQTGNTYLAHAVGAGKTIEMIAGGMEQKRLGLIKKPMYVVPNHMLEQFSNEFMELYPLANIMVADDENFSPERRKAFIASATLNNPDAIVITHDAFQRIGVKEESVAPIRDEILADLEIELSETAKGNDTRVRRGQLEQQIEAVKQRFDRIIGAGAKDSTIKFEDMGVDFVFADEAHVFRKLDFHTAQQIKGIDPNGSKRALDMYVKTRILDKRKPGRSMVFASGTPVTNTMGELYTIMRFFAGAELDKSGISTFDAWARQFGEVAPALEPNAAGKYELIERFAKFDNVPELMSRVRQFMDVLTSDNLGALVKRPNIIGGKPNLNIIPTNSDLTEYMKGELARRIEISRAWKPSKDEPHNPDPIVAIITDGRFAAIDPRFFGGTLKEGDKSIITEMGDKVVASYHATKNDVYLDKDKNEEKIKGSTQIVFYNLGFGEQSQKSRGFNSRAAFTKRLTDGGIPRAEIAWFDDANSDAKKEAVFKAMRNGTIKVLIGSAKKMGTGVNVQKRLAVLHYQDPPWFPADVEQPHGRILRQGNQNEEIAIEWYTTKGTYQSTMWQMVGRKQRFIDQAFTGDKTLRSMDDLGEASLFEQAAAVASGDPRAIQLAGLKQDVERFTRLQAAHANEQINVRSSLNSATWQIESGQKSIRTLEKAFKAIGEKYFSFTAGRVNGRDYMKPGEFGQAIKDEFNKVAADSVMGELVQDKQIASLGAAIKVTMDAYVGKDNKPDGTFDFYVEFGGSSYQLGNTTAMGADVDATGLARRIFNKINEVDTNLQRAKRELAANEVDANKLRKKLGAPFEYQQEMAEKYGELKRLEAELEAEGRATPAPANAPFVVNADGTANGEDAEASTNLKQTGAPEANESDVVFSRPTFSRGAQSQANESVERLATGIASHWENAPKVVVAFDMNDPIIPENVRKEDQRQRSGGATGTPEGFYYKGVVYLMSSKLGTANDVARVLFHEALGHAGLRGAFGGSLKPILREIATLRRAEVEAKLKQYGLKGINKIDRLIAAEEVLAEMAQTRPEIGFVKRAIAAIRTWLRQNVPGFNSLRVTDDELIRNYILPARRFVENGGGPKGGVRVEPTFSRGTNGAVTKSNDVVGNQGGRSADDTTPGGLLRKLEGTQVVDSNGAPLLVYHGSKSQIDRFDASKTIDGGLHFGSKSQASMRSSKNLHPAYIYAENLRRSKDTGGDWKGKIASAKAAGYDGIVYLNRYEGVSKETVFRLHSQELSEKLDRMSDAEFRRAVPEAEDSYIVFDAKQVIQPNESTAPDSGGAMFSRTLGETVATAANNVHDVSLPAGYTVGDLLKSAPGKVSWWHKTVGTMYNLAERSPQFKRVFDGVQNFINDVSYYATEAADLAPNILPKLETWKDIGKSPLSAEDTKAISAPIFEGTLTWARDEQGKPIKIEALEAQAATLTPEQKAQRLLRNDKVSDQVLKMWQGLPLDQYESIIEGKYEREMLKAGVVWTDAELRAMFNLTDKQIPLYREFRAATDKSLTNLAISDMLRFGGKDVEPIRNRVLSTDNVVQAGDMLRDYLLEMSDMDPARKDVLLDTANKMVEKSEKAKDLIERGYAPLSRYGQYTLDVVSVDGERVYFGMFESKMDASRMARKMEQEYPGATMTRGTVSEEEYKLFAGVSPETLELFGDMLGLEAQGDSAASKAFQTYLKLAKSNRSSMKRMIQRKGIAGFSEDSGRVLAGFVYSNARQTASNLHMGEMTDAANEVAKTQGELKDQAVRLVDYVKNPREEAQAFRGLLFAQYIGGSVASAMVNMTQPFAMTFPWLSQYTSVADASKQMASAMKDANRKHTGDNRLDAALKRAEEDGTVSPQEVHQLMQQSQGRGALRSGDGTKAGDAMAAANNALSRFSLGWGKLFSLAEQFNRRATFIAAYRTAVAKGIDAPEAFARKAIAETQGIYNKGNKPNWARGAVGSTLFTFKQYSIAYVEMLHRMATQGGPEGKKAAMLALAVLFLMSGAGGMPGGDDLDDLISGIMQRLGYNYDSKTKRQEFFASIVGEGGAQFLERGVSGLPGVPLDVSGRLGMGNLIPGTGLLVKKVDHTRDLAEIAGPGGDFVKRGFDAAGKVLDGNVFGANGAAATVAPKAIQNLYQSYDMANMGMYRDAKGMKVLDTGAADSVLKAIGFQPNDVKKVQDASFETQRMIGLNKLRETEIANRWALGIFEKDSDKVKAAREELAQWNTTNPESPIRINFKQILQRVQKMNQTKAERITATAPKEIRADVRRALDVQ